MKWIPLATNFEKFRNQMADNGITDEIIMVNPEIFGNEEEMDIFMVFYDGYGIEKRDDGEAPLIMLYPTLDQIKFDWNLKTLILDYTQGSSETDITPYDSALTFGVLFKANDLGVVWKTVPLCSILPDSLIVDSNNVMFHVDSISDTYLYCTLIHNNGFNYTADQNGKHTIERGSYKWTVFFEPSTDYAFPFNEIQIKDIQKGAIITDRENIFKCIETTENYIICSLMQGNAENYFAEGNGTFHFYKCNVCWHIISYGDNEQPNNKKTTKNDIEYKVHILFGSEACKAYYNNDIQQLIESNVFFTRTFKTEAEKNAYLLAINDHDGWIEACTLSQEEDADIIDKLKSAFGE